MIALEIHLNGQRLCLAGADDLSVLGASVDAVGPLGSKGWHSQPPGETSQEAAPISPRLNLQVGGLASRGPGIEDSHLGWCRGVSIGVGDTVTVRILDVDPAEADLPTGASTSARNERQLFERAKKTYLSLREKYGDAAV